MLETDGDYLDLNRFKELTESVAEREVFFMLMKCNTLKTIQDTISKMEIPITEKCKKLKHAEKFLFGSNSKIEGFSIDDFSALAQQLDLAFQVHYTPSAT